MSMIKEFKQFVMRGNVVDMAVGIIIGGAFGKIVSSLVSDIIMPPIGLLVGGVDFSDLVITLKAATEGTDAVTISYGVFIKALVDFIIIAFAIFMMIRALNRMKRKEEEKPAAPPVPPKSEVLLEEIRDLLKSKR
jgi:large conductance mechanosensitive channel